MEFAKYRTEIVRPLLAVPSLETRRMSPADIIGKVAPRRIDCGRMSAPASNHFTTKSIDPPARAGKSDEYAKFVVAMKMS